MFCIVISPILSLIIFLFSLSPSLNLSTPDTPRLHTLHVHMHTYTCTQHTHTHTTYTLPTLTITRLNPQDTPTRQPLSHQAPPNSRSLLRAVPVSRQHLVQTSVVHAALHELLLRQHPVVVDVHLAKDLLCPLLGRLYGLVLDG